MKNYVYYMNSDGRSPVSETMTLKEWFYEYKWMVEGEVFVPASLEDCSSAIVPGDRLWFTLYEKVVGYVTVLRLAPSMNSGQHEIWFDGSSCREAAAFSRFSLPIIFSPGVFEVLDEAVKEWLIPE